MVSIKVTKQGAAQRILAGRASINSLTEETHTIRSLPVSVAQVRARCWQLTNRRSEIIYIYGLFIEKTARLQLHKTIEAERNHTRIHYDTQRCIETQEYVKNTNIHTLIIINVAEIVEVIFVVVSVKVTKHGAAQGVFAGRTSINPLTEETRILAGRAIVDPLAEETHSRRSLPVSRAKFRTNSKCDMVVPLF